MHIAINQIFRATTQIKENIPRDSDGYFSNRYVTSMNGILGSSANVSRPMFWFKDENGICSALIFNSNPFQNDKSSNPWRDIIFPAEGARTILHKQIY